MTPSDAGQTERSKIRVLLADDHPMLRTGLASQLGKEPDIEVCGGVDSGHAALDLAATLKPDLAIVDLALPDMDGLELIKDLTSRHPTLAILVFSMRDERLYAERALRAGARGYVMKGETPEAVVAAVRRVMSGAVHLSGEMADAVLGRSADRAPDAAPSPEASLSDRELQVLSLMGKGLGPRQIAEALHLSARTVETYRTRIREKLNVEDAAALRQYAVRWMRLRE